MTGDTYTNQSGDSFKIPTQHISAECLNRHCPECPNFDVCGGRIEEVEYVAD